MKKKITKKGYRVLAVIWTLAAASMAVAFVRYLPLEINLFLLLMTVVSMLAAANFWRAYHRIPEEESPNLFDFPPRFADNPVLFDDDPEPSADVLNKDSEEKKP